MEKTDLIIQCESLLENKISDCNIYIEQQEEFRSQLIEANEDYKFLRKWLEIANEDCFSMKFNDGDLTQIYETLLMNNFVNDFIEYGVAKGKLNLKFLSTMIQIKNLRNSLNSLKLDYEEMQYREVLMQINSTKESLEFSEFKKKLQLKSDDIMNECDRSSTYLKEAYEAISALKLKHDDLVRRYDLLLQNTTVKKFLNYTKDLEKSSLESPQKLNTKQRCRGFMSNDRRSGKFTNDSIPNSSVRRSTNVSNSNAGMEFSSSPEIREKNNENSSADKDESLLDAKCNSALSVADDLVKKQRLDRMEKRYWTVKSKLCSSSNRVSTSICRKQKSTSNQPSNSVVTDSSATDFFCNICNRYYSTKTSLNTHKQLVHEGLQEYKCTVCGKVLKTKYSLEIHEAKHSLLRPFECPICNRCYPHFTSLWHHAWRSHNKKLNKNKLYKETPEPRQSENSSGLRVNDAFKPKRCNGRYELRSRPLTRTSL